jgi:hypothetical protein
VQGTSPLEVVASPKEYTSYASLSLKQKKKITAKGIKGLTRFIPGNAHVEGLSI